MNYRGYFRGTQSDIQYSVRIITDKASSQYTEILLAGDSPFKVSYEVSKTPFDPIRKSTASFHIVSDDYLMDIFSPYATGTTIELWNETSNTIEWKGYLKPNLYNQGYVHCVENIELEASDCICALQYFDYDNVGDAKSLVTFKSIIDHMMNRIGIGDYYVSRTKKIESGWFDFSKVTISEKNFYSSDATEDPWTYEQVMEELCKYFGFTCVQWKGSVYFIDYQHLAKNNAISAIHYSGSNYTAQGTVSLGNTLEVHTTDGDEIMGANHQISLDTIYNKVSVNCNQYSLDKFIPDIFDDELIENACGDWNKCFYITPEDGRRQYINSKAKIESESAPDTDFTYVHRVLSHKDFSGRYYLQTYPNVTPISVLINEQTTKHYCGCTLIDYASYDKLPEETYNFEPTASLDFTRYLCVNMGNKPVGYKFDPIINNNSAYQALYGLPSMTWNELPPVYTLNTGYTCPIAVSENAFIYINADVLYTRYLNKNYINPKWTDESTAVTVTDKGKTKTKLRHKDSGIMTFTPALEFKLGVGNKYWNGSSWTTTDTCFRVPVSCNTVDKDSTSYDDNITDFGHMWNTTFHILNNFSWEEWAGCEGYKIPLDNTLDFSQPITFELRAPSKMQVYETNHKDRGPVAAVSLNGYAWISNLKIGISNKGKDAEKESDVIYENILSETSTNELSEIDLKINTYPGKGAISFSNVGLAGGGILSAIIEDAIDGTVQKPEYNIIDKYTDQYSTKTRKETFTLTRDFTPFQRVRDHYWDKEQGATYFAVLGQEIDYAEDKQSITMIELKH